MKEKWYLATGRESAETQRKVTKVLLQGHGVWDNIGWYWHDADERTRQRNFEGCSKSTVIVAYTLGEHV